MTKAALAFAVLRRAGACLFAYLLSVLSAGAVLFLVFGVIGPRGINTEWLGVVMIMMIFIAALAAIPAFLCIITAELAGIRHWLFFSLGGATAALADMGAIGALSHAPRSSNHSWLLTSAFLAAGGVAGLVYWSVAGRRSGQLRAARSVRL